jgi:hypothetical protein
MVPEELEPVVPSTGATGAVSIEPIPPFHGTKFPGFYTYTGPIGGVVFRSTTVRSFDFYGKSNGYTPVLPQLPESVS